MDVDPMASMRLWAVDVEIAGSTFEIPALPAVTWFPILASGDLARILDLIEDTEFDDALIDTALNGDELADALIDAVEAVTGRSWHVTLVLATVASSHWPTIGGELARRGFRWDASPIGAALDAIYVTIVESLDEAGRKKFKQLLGNTALTTGGKRVDRDQALSDFELMAGPRPDTVRSTGERSGGGRPKTPPRPKPPHQGDQ